MIYWIQTFALGFCGVAYDHMFGKGLFIRSVVYVFRERLSILVCVLLSLFCFEDGLCDLIVLGPDHCLYFFVSRNSEPAASVCACVCVRERENSRYRGRSKCSAFTL